MTIPKASVFLSHSSNHKDLVHKFAEALARRGIEPWLDIHHLYPGTSIASALTKAIEEQSFFIIFLSKEVLDSDWVKDELKQAIALEEAGKSESIIPIFLERLDELGEILELLPQRWINESKTQFDRLGVEILDNYQAQKLDQIALVIAQSFYNKLSLPTQREINLAFDQRGTGDRSFAFPIPKSLERIPTLVFRQDLGSQSKKEILLDSAWEHYKRLIEESLGKANLGRGNRNRKVERVHIHGNYQLGIAYFLGQYFDAKREAKLHVYNKDHDTIFSNAGFGELKGGDPFSARINQVEDHNQPESRIAFYIGKKAYLLSVKEHIRTEGMDRKLVMIATERYMEDGAFKTNEQVKRLIRNVLAVLRDLHKEYQVRHAQLYCDLPNNVLPLLSAELDENFPVTMEFMEWHADRKCYFPLSMKFTKQK